MVSTSPAYRCSDMIFPGGRIWWALHWRARSRSLATDVGTTWQFEMLYKHFDGYLLADPGKRPLGV